MNVSHIDTPSGSDDQPGNKGLGNVEPQEATPAETVPVTPTLATYFGPDRPTAPAFLKAVRARKVIRFTDADASEASRSMEEHDPDGQRLWALVAQPKLPDAVDRWIWLAVQQRLKTEVPEAFEALEHDPLATFRLIRKGLSPSLASSEKKHRKRGEILLRLCLAWLVSRRELDPLAALEHLTPTFYRDAAGAGRAARRILTRGNIAEIKEAAAIAGLSQETVRDAISARDEERRRQALTQSQLEVANARITDLQAEVASLKGECESVLQSLATEKMLREQDNQHAGHDISALKAQQRNLLRERLKPLLSDAVDALEIEPAIPHISVEKMKIALFVIDEAIK